VQDKMNQKESEQDEVDGMKKGAETKGNMAISNDYTNAADHYSHVHRFNTLLLSGSVKRPEAFCNAMADLLLLTKNTAADPSK